MNCSNYAAERAAVLPMYEVSDVPVEEVKMTYPNGMTRAEYDALESPHFSDDEDDFDIEAADHLGYDDDEPLTTGTFNYGFDPTELDAESGHRAFCNNFTD